MSIEVMQFEAHGWGSRMLFQAIKVTGIEAWQRGWSRDRPAYTIIDATKHEPQYGLPYVMYDTAGTPRKYDFYPHVHRKWSWEFELFARLIVAKYDELKPSDQAIIDLDRTFPNIMREGVNAGWDKFMLGDICAPNEIFYKPPQVP